MSRRETELPRFNMGLHNEDVINSRSKKFHDNLGVDEHADRSRGIVDRTKTKHITPVYDYTNNGRSRLDEDDEYYYIGHNDKSFNQVVNKKYIVHIELSSAEKVQEEQDLEFLDSLIDRPDEDTGIN